MADSFELFAGLRGALGGADFVTTGLVAAFVAGFADAGFGAGLMGAGFAFEVLAAGDLAVFAGVFAAVLLLVFGAGFVAMAGFTILYLIPPRPTLRIGRRG